MTVSRDFSHLECWRLNFLSQGYPQVGLEGGGVTQLSTTVSFFSTRALLKLLYLYVPHGSSGHRPAV